MRFFWVMDTVEQGKIFFKYYSGKENLGDYQSKHHIGVHTTQQYAHGIYMNCHQYVNYLELVSLAL